MKFITYIIVITIVLSSSHVYSKGINPESFKQADSFYQGLHLSMDPNSTAIGVNWVKHPKNDDNIFFTSYSKYVSFSNQAFWAQKKLDALGSYAINSGGYYTFGNRDGFQVTWGVESYNLKLFGLQAGIGYYQLAFPIPCHINLTYSDILKTVSLSISTVI